MKAIAKTKAELGVEIIDAPIPRPGPNEILVRVAACGICGSDLHIYLWELGADRIVSHLPTVIGHEPAGEVVEAGAGVNWLQGGRSCRARSLRSLRKLLPVPLGTFQLLREAGAVGWCVRGILHRADRECLAGAEVDGYGIRRRCSNRSRPDCTRSKHPTFRAGDSCVVEGPGPIGLSTALVGARARRYDDC